LSVKLTVLPHARLVGLGVTAGKDDADTLGARGEFFAANRDLQGALFCRYPSDAHFAAYTAWSGETQYASIPRLKGASLRALEGSGTLVRMSFLALDIDLHPAGRRGNPQGTKGLWRDEGEFRDWLSRLRDRAPFDVGAVYSTTHGARIVFPLTTPFAIGGPGAPLDAADRWKQAYLGFCQKIGPVGPSGETPDLACKDWTRLFRLPLVTRRGTALSSIIDWREGQIELSEYSLGKAPSPSSPSAAAVPSAATGSDPAVLELLSAAEAVAQDRLSELTRDPLYAYCVQNPGQVPYALWRAVGTNLLGVTKIKPELGRRAFHSLSRLDRRRYTEGDTDKVWEGIVDSARQGYGPVTYGEMASSVDPTTWAEIWAQDAPVDGTSMAGRVSQRISAQPSVESVQARLKPSEVFALLKLTQRSDGGLTVARFPENLMTIIRYDEYFSGNLRRNLLGPTDEWKGRALTDTDVDEHQMYISLNYGQQWPVGEVERKLRWACSKDIYHPVQVYLRSLSWAGKDHVPDLLDVLGLPPTPYYTLLLRRWLVSAVARPLQIETTAHPSPPRPNYKVDTILVLQGPQGYHKSTFFAEILPRNGWFSDSLPPISGPNQKDASVHMLNYWIIECSEVERTFNQKTLSLFKAFASRLSERFRPPYGRSEIQAFRPSILVATTNEREFLVDPTGDRRFWVLPVTRPIDTVRLASLRDQLWAQAVHAFDSGESWWLTHSEDALRDQENNAYRRVDVTDELVSQWLENDTSRTVWKGKTYLGGFTLPEVIHRACGIPVRDQTSRQWQRVGRILRGKGFEKQRIMVEREVRRVYLCPVSDSEGLLQ